jgi:hypothetical protein
MVKRETAKVSKKASKARGDRSRSWKEYFANAPRLPDDFPRRIRDRPPEKIAK